MYDYFALSQLDKLACIEESLFSQEEFKQNPRYDDFIHTIMKSISKSGKNNRFSYKFSLYFAGYHHH